MLRQPGVFEQTWACSIVQHWPQVLQFSVPRINLLSTLLRCNGLAGIEKAIVHDASSRPPNSDYDLFWCKFGFGKCFGTSSPFNHWASHCQLSYKIHFLSHITFWWRNGWLLLHTIREDNISKWWFFFLSLLRRHSFIEIFQMLSDCKMVGIWVFRQLLASL